MFQQFPYGVGFQASATPGIVYDRERAPFIENYTDLADERLRQRLTMPAPGDITCGGILMGIAAALDLDYQDPAEMTEAIDFAIEAIHPNVLQYTTDSATMQQLLRGGVVDAVGFWNSLARMEFLNGQTNTAFMIAPSGQFLANGYMWIPKGTPHPVLAQIFVDWRLSDDGWCLLSPSGGSAALTQSERRLCRRLFDTPGELVSREALIEALTDQVHDFDAHRIESRNLSICVQQMFPREEAVFPYSR